MQNGWSQLGWQMLSYCPKGFLGGKPSCRKAAVQSRRAKQESGKQCSRYCWSRKGLLLCLHLQQIISPWKPTDLFVTKMHLRQTDLPEPLLASIDVTVRVQEHKTQDVTELHRSVLCPIMVPWTQFLTSHPGSPTEPKSEYLNLTFHGVEARNLPTCQVTYCTMSHLSWLPFDYFFALWRHKEGILFLTWSWQSFPLFLEVQLIITITRKTQLRSRAVAKHCVAGSLASLWLGSLHHRCH